MRPTSAWLSSHTQLRRNTPRGPSLDGPLFFWEDSAQPSDSQHVTQTRMAAQSHAILVATRIIHPASSIHSPEEAKKLNAQLEAEYKERYETYKKLAE